jgi:hypothetical protein
MGMKRFYLTGTNYLLKKMYYDGKGGWVSDKKKAMLFSVETMNSTVRKSSASADIMHIKVEWED